MNQFEKSEFLEAFGKHVKELRMEKGLSQEELANLVGYTSDNARSSINKIESGKSDLPASKIRSLAEGLGVSASQLITWDRQLNPDDKLAKDVKIIELIAKECNKEAAYAFSEFLKLDDPESKKILELISMYSKLDELDRAEVRGYVFSKIEDMLKADKYRKKESSIDMAM